MTIAHGGMGAETSWAQEARRAAWGGVVLVIHRAMIVASGIMAQTPEPTGTVTV